MAKKEIEFAQFDFTPLFDHKVKEQGKPVHTYKLVNKNLDFDGFLEDIKKK